MITFFFQNLMRVLAITYLTASICQHLSFSFNQSLLSFSSCSFSPYVCWGKGESVAFADCR